MKPSDQQPARIRVAITGHTNLSGEAAALIYADLVDLLAGVGSPVHGITCLAPGADQLFARAVLATHGDYEVIIPADDYRERALPARHRADFDELLARADEVSYTGFSSSSVEAFAAASLEMLSRADRMVAVWDGTQVGVAGGTADLVREARRRRLPVSIVWPSDARRG